MKGPRIVASRLASLIAISAALAAVGGAALAGAQSSAPDPGAHLLVVPDTAQGEAALASTDARVVARYDSFTLVEAAGTDDERLRRAGADRRDDMRTVATAAGELDPKAERPSLAAKGGSDPDETLALVQFVGPPKEAWLEHLRETGVRVVGYAAQNGYLVHAEGHSVGRLAGLVGDDTAVRAVTAVRPSDKLFGGARAGRMAVQTLAGEAGADARRQALARGTRVRDDLELGGLETQFLRLNRDDVPALAGDPGVVAVEPQAEPRLLDERASQIVAGNFAAGVPSAAPGYLEWLQTNGFDGSTFDFAIDVTDEGLDTGFPTPTHPDFFDHGVSAGPDRVRSSA